jgi:hypothetical protein
LLEGYELPLDVWGLFLEFGRTTAEVMIQWGMELRQKKFPNGKPLALTLDTYSPHRSEEVQAAAQRLNIELVFIPSGFTDKLQLFNHKVFGVLETKAWRWWRTRDPRSPRQKTTHADVAGDLLHLWREINPNTFDSSSRICDST